MKMCIYQLLENLKLKELDSYYRLTDSQYCALVGAYNDERESAKAKRQLKEFPPLSLWNHGNPKHQHLAISLWSGLVTALIVLAPTLSRQAVEGQLNIPLTHRVNSLLPLTHPMLTWCQAAFCINEIWCLVVWKSYSQTHLTAKNMPWLTLWFECFPLDNESGLHSINLKAASSFPPIASLHDLSPPLIHVADVEDKNRLWLLNHFS